MGEDESIDLWVVLRSSHSWDEKRNALKVFGPESKNRCEGYIKENAYMHDGTPKPGKLRLEKAKVVW